MNVLREKLAAGRVIGCIQTLASADITEVLAGTGIDMLMLDQEHGFGGLQEVVAQLRALKGTEVPALVRVPSHDPAYVHRLQDAGVSAILFPGVESAEQAQALVRMCRYPPAGSRGAGGGLRATGYDADMAYFGRANADMLVAVQIESALGVEAASEICAVEGIELVVLGPRDLSASIGQLGRFESPEVQALFALAEQRVLASAVPCGSTIYPGQTAAQLFARGHRLLLAGTDVGFLARSARAVVEAPR